jgi:hypothetical protein
LLLFVAAGIAPGLAAVTQIAIMPLLMLAGIVGLNYSLAVHHAPAVHSTMNGKSIYNS